MALYDITNTPVSSAKTRTVRKRLSDGCVKAYSYQKTVRKQFELCFSDESEKFQFEQSLGQIQLKLNCRSVKDTLIKLVKEYPLDTRSSDNEATPVGLPLLTSTPKSVSTTARHTKGMSPMPLLMSPADSNAKDCQDTPETAAADADHDHFVSECGALLKLLDLLCEHNRRCRHPLEARSLQHDGHVLLVHLVCAHNHNLQWASSSAMGSSYTVNMRMMLAYMCSGVKPVEYDRISDFADFGKVTDHYLEKFLVTMGAITECLKKQSVFRARAEESSSSADETISIMTDARHACRKNSYHSDHVALGMNTHKVVDIQHVNKKDDTWSQRHEVFGFEKMYQNFATSNITVKNHVHDRNASINKRLRERGQAKNCNDRWHCTRPITAGLRKIGQGAKKNMGKTWHPQLSDKGSLLRNHVYWAMDNCGGEASKLRSLIDVCIQHFQNNHADCDQQSNCKGDGYTPAFVIVTDPVAVGLLTTYVHSLVVYKSAEDYVLGKDTYYVESFNNVCLLYLDKRIHYGDHMYELRSNLAVLDWNEHVDRPFTSINRSRNVHHLRQHSGKKVYQRKTYRFVQDIWDMLVYVSDDEPSDISSDSHTTLATDLDSSGDDLDIGVDGLDIAIGVDSS